MSGNDVETHFATPHIRWFLAPADGPAPHDGKPRICCYTDSSPYVQYATLKQKWLPMVAGQGREPEWRDIVLVTEGEDG